MKTFNFLVACAAAAVASSSASAAITFDPVESIAEADVLTAVAGSTNVVYAVSFAGLGSDLDVNGTTFASAGTSNADVSTSGFAGAGSAGNAGAIDAADVTFNSFTQNFQDVLVGGLFGGADFTGEITLNNLTNGTDYLVQVFVHRNDPNDRLLTLTSANSVTLNSSEAPGAIFNEGLGQYTIGSFTASGTTETFDVTGGGPGLAFAQLSAIVVAEVVPEPASFALVGMGALAMLGRRRQA